MKIDIKIPQRGATYHVGQEDIMKLFKTLFFIALFLISLSTFAADDPQTLKPILKKGDVARFIKTFPLLKKDLDKYNVKYSGKNGTFTYGHALAANQEFLGILKKHGWDENFFQKTAVIALGFSTIVYKKELKNVDPQMQKAIEEIKNNPNVPESTKQQMIQQMKMAKGALKKQEKEMKKALHPADLALIKPLINELKTLFDGK